LTAKREGEKKRNGGGHATQKGSIPQGTLDMLILQRGGKGEKKKKTAESDFASVREGKKKGGTALPPFWNRSGCRQRGKSGNGARAKFYSRERGKGG